MARPTTKDGLIEAANDQYGKLLMLIDAMPAATQQAEFAFEDRDRNVRDVLIHLHGWHQLLLNWVAANRAGQAVPFLPEPYNWKTYPQMNIELRDRHQDTSFDQAYAQLKTSHAEVVALIESFTEDELFTKRHFRWTGTTNLASYCISATSSHYAWAVKKLKLHK